MSHLSVLLTPATTPTISRIIKKTTHLPSLRTVRASCRGTERIAQGKVQRRSIALGLVGAVVGLSIGGEEDALAARRATPPPVQEKKDPNVSGLTAKVLASKKRKEAMKELMSKLRENGKTIQELTQQPDSSD